MIHTGQQTMINSRGRVCLVTVEEVELRRSQGWKIINNPRQDYYPEWDVSAGGRSAPENIIDDIADTDILPAEEV